MPNPNENRKWLYDKLTAKGVKMGTYEQFDKAIDDENNLKWVYDKANSQGLKVGDYNQFSGAMKRVAAEAPATDEKPVAETVQPAETATQAAPEALATENVEEKPATKPAAPPKKPTMTDSYKVPEINTPFTQQERPDVPVPFAPETPVNSTEVKNTDEKAAAELREQTERDVQRYGTGTETYSADDAAYAGRLYEEISAENEALAKEIERYNKTGQGNYTALSERQRNLRMKTEELRNSAAWKEYNDLSDRYRTLSAATETPEIRFEKVRLAAELSRNPIARVGMGNQAPSESQINFDLNRAEAEYIESQMETADRAKKKEYKARLKELNREVLDNDYYQADVARRIAENQSALEDLTARMRKLEQEALTHNTPGNMTAADTWLRSNLEYRNLTLAANERSQAIRRLEHIQDKNASDFWVNFMDVFTDMNTYDFGITNLEKALATKVASDTPDADDGSNELLEAVAGGNAVAAEEGQYVEGKGRYGQIAAQSIPFMLQFRLTGGFGNVAEAVGSRFAKAVGKEMADKFLVKVTGAVLGDIAAGFVAANTIGGAKTMSDILNNYYGTLVSDGEGGFEYEGGQGLGRSVWGAEVGNTLEYSSERAGDHMQRLLGKSILGWGIRSAQRNGKGAVNLAVEELAKTMNVTLKDFGFRSANQAGANWVQKAMGGMFKALNQMGVQGYPFEVAEEYVGLLGNIILGGEEKWMDFSKLGDKETHTDIWGGMLYSIGLTQAGAVAMGGVGAGVNGIRKAQAYHQLENALEVNSNIASTLLGENEWKGIKETIDGTINKELPKKVVEYMNNQEYDPQQRAAILDYVKNTYLFRGFNAGTIAQARERISAPENLQSLNINAEAATAQDQISDAYMLGYQQSTEKRADVEQADLDRKSRRRAIDAIEQREEIEQAVSRQKARMAELTGIADMSAEDASRLLADEAQSQEVRDSALDYLMALAVEQGFDDAENNRQLREKALIEGRLKQQYGKFYYENPVGESVVETSQTPNPATKRWENIFLLASEPNENGEVPFVALQTGRKGYVKRDQLAEYDDAGNIVPGLTKTQTLNEFLDEQYAYEQTQREAQLAQEDAEQTAQRQTEEAQQAQQGFREAVENVEEEDGSFIYNGQRGRLIRKTDEGAVFVPDEGENVRVTWSELAAELRGEGNPAPAPALGDEYGPVIRTIDTKKGKAEVRTKTTEKDGVRTTKVVTIRNGEEIGSKQSIPLPDGYKIKDGYEFDGTVEVLGITELREADDGRSAADFLVKLENGAIETLSVPIERVSEEPVEEPVEEAPRIPLDKNGNPIYDAPGPQPPTGGSGGAELDFRGNQIPMRDGQVDEEAFRESDPEAWAAWNDALPEDDPRKATLGTKKRLEGLAKSAKSAADKAQKDLEKLYDKGATDKEIREKEAEVRDQRARQKRYEDAIASMDKRELDKAEAEREAARKAAEAERLRREKEKEEEEKRKAGKAPDISEDTPEAAQKRGYIMVNGNRIDRPTPDAVAEKGKDTKIAFTKSVAVDGKYGLVEATRIEPSHISDQENPLHFFAKKWQPKNRKRADSAVAIQQMANGIRPGEITRGETAYGGAPIVNERGEVIQGNGRSEALRRAYGQGTAAEYKAWLAEHAEEFGLTREQVEKMETPILVRVLDVDDARAEQLGKMEQKDLESGGDQRFNGKTLVKKMGRRFGEFLDYLFAGDLGDDATALDYINQNGFTALHWLHQNGFINDTEYANAQENGKLTEETVSAFRAMSIEPLFDNVPEKVRSGFEMLPNSVKLALQRSVATLYGLEGVIGDIQDALAYYCDFETADPAFKKAKNTEEAWNAVAAWMQNVRFDGTSEGEAHPSIVARRLASVFKGGVLVEGEKNPKRTEKAYRSLFANIASTMRGEGGFMSAAEPTDNIGAYRENNVITEEEENQIRNGKNDNRPGPASGSGANVPVGGQGSGPVREGRPGGVPERKPAGEGTGPVAPEAPAAPAPEPSAPKTGYGANNTLVTNEDYEELKKQWAELMGDAGTLGIVPKTMTLKQQMKLVSIGAQMAAYHIEAGVRKFVELSQKLLQDVGESIRPYLKALYKAARELPGIGEYAKDMNTDAEVDAIDVDAIGKETEAKPSEEKKDYDAPLNSLSEIKDFMREIGYKGNLSKVLESNGKKFVKYEANGSITPNIYIGETTRRDVLRQFFIYRNVMDVNIPEDIRANFEKEAADAKELRDQLYADDREKIKKILNDAGIPFVDVIDSERGSRIVYTNRKSEGGNYMDYTDHADPDQVKEDIEFIRATSQRLIQQESKENPSESAEKSVTSQEENLEQGSLFGEPEPAPEEKTPVKVEIKKEQGNGLQGNDGAVLPEGLPTDSRGPEGQPGEGSQRAGEGEGSEAGGTDGGGQRDRAGDVRPDQPRPDDSVKKNTRNNRVSRGETVYPKTPAARYRANLAAIRLLKQIEQEGREATKEEMEVLRKFTGWGGLGSFFNNRRSLESREISEVLTTDEIQAAENSINTAYYTPVEVIDAMWDIAKKLGFKGGRVLEGSAGIGNILASMPEAISNRSDIQAVELDPITGGILRLLYPDASVLIDGFENADIPNNSVDLAITNVPFGDDIRVYDEKEKDLTRKFGGRIHDFCIAKNIRKLKEGGIAIFITSRSTLDSASKTLRNWIVNEGGADVIGVFRLNNDTFEGTGATSDIIVVRKRVNGEVSPDAINIQDTSIVRRETYEATDRNGDTSEAKAAMEINDYFAEHPENMGGEMAFGFEKGDSYRPGSSALWPADGVNQSERLEKWVSGFRQQVQIAKRETAEEPEQANARKEGQLVLNSKGKLCISRRGQAVPLDVNDSKVAGYTKAQVVKDYDAIKTALDAVLRYQLDNATDEGLSPLLRKLNSAYDTFVSRYGYLNKNRSITFLRSDVDFPSIAALESYREKKDITGKVTVSVSKAPVFSGRVLGQKTTPTPKDVRDGVIVSMTQFGRIDIPFIAKALGRDEESVRKEALKSGLCFENPENGTVEVEYEYLSGNVREKLAYAESHNEDGKYDANIKALKEVIPRDIPAHLIEFSLGSDWLPVSLYTEYAKEKFGVNNDFIPQHFGGSWGVANEYYGQHNDKNISGGVRSEKLGGLTKTGVDLMLAAMNKQTVKFSIVIKEPDGSKRTETDKEASQAAATKIDEMRDDFKEWCRKRMLNDKELSESIAKTYNDTFNAIAPKRISEIFSPEHFEGQVETMGGKPFHLYPHQSQAVVRATTQPLMMAHEVGTGKTFTLITTAMEMRRLGTAKKPMIVVQNATLGQFVSSAKALYPNAKILTISEKDRTREGRSEFYAKIKYNDWDMVIVPQSVFEMIPDSEKRKRDYIEAKIDEARHILAQATEAKNAAAKKRLEEEIKDLEYERDFGEKRPKKKSDRDAKREAKVQNNAKARAQQQLDRKTDEVADFDDMGIDALLVDEAHNYKRLGFSTSMAQGVKGVDPAYSKKSAGVYLKTRAVFDKAGWKNVVFATGTPISNTAAEIWTFMRYMMPDDMMRELHIYYFDDFVSNFGNISQSLEFTTSGKFKENSRFASYTNLPELIRIWSSVTDTVLTKDAVAAKADAGEEAEKLDDKVPVMESWTDDEGNVHENQARDIYLPQSPSLVRIMNAVRARLEWYESLTGKEKKQNSSVPLVMYGLAKMAAIDPRLVDRNAADEPQSKTNKAVEETLRALKDSERYKGTCALFSDNFRRVEKTADGKTVEAFNLFEEIKRKLVAAGVPEDQIVIIKNGMSVQAKEKIFAAVNAGDIRVIMGTTASLGTGVNIQERLFFEAHLDAPNRPMDYTQRMGRILRQGNLHKQWGIPVRVVRFGVEDSLDVTAYQRLSTKSKFINSIMDGRPLIENGMENRILEEEEEGVFDNPVAVLSGSQYAMLKSAAERELRKLRSKKEQHRQDQIYIESNLKYNEGAIKNIKDRIKESEKWLSVINEKFPDGKIDEIVIEGKKVSTAEEIAAALKEKIFDPLKAAAEQRKKYAEEGNWLERTREESKEFSIKVNGVLVHVYAFITPEEDWRTRKISISTTVRYEAMELGIDGFTTRRMPNGINGVKEIINDFRDNVASGKLQRENIESYNDRIARLEADNESMMARRGKPFADEAKLAEQEKLVEDLTQKMKDEMAEKEAKYASQAAGIDGSTFDLDAASESTEEEDGEEGDLYRTSDEIAEEYPNWMDDQTSTEVEGSQRGQNTQVAGTVGTYRKVGDWIESNLGKDTKVLDASSGLGLGTLELRERGFDVDDIEPYPGKGRKEQPTYGGEDAYQQAVDDGKEYDFIISNAVLNVIPDDWRAGVLHNMARLLKPGGRMFINTRKAGEERTIKNKIELDSPQEVLVGTPERINSYQRFFTPAELKEYVERELGDGYTVEIANKRNSGTSGLAAVVVTKKAEGERNRRGENLRNPIDRASAIVKINEIANKLGVKFEEDPNLKAKGVFSPKTGKIRINIDAHRNTADLEATLLHEAVAHYGLRKLFGKDWKELRMRLYEQASPEIKARVDAIAKADGLSTEVAMEEYIAQLAEDGRFDEQEESFWQKIVSALKQLLAKIGFNSGYLTDEDFRAMLYASYRNLQTGGALETAARVATAAALRRNAEASHEDNGPEDDGPGGGLPAGTEEDMMGRGNDDVVREVSADLYDRYENQNGEDKPWMSENELIDRIEEELPYGIETKELFAKIDEYRRLDEEDFNEGRRDFSGSERDNVFREIMAELERLSEGETDFSELPDNEREQAEDMEIDQDSEENYRRDRGYSEAKTADDMYDRKTSTVGSALYTAQVDEYAPLDAFQQAIAAEAKKELSENERVSNRLRELGGQAMNEVRTYNEKFLQPMWKAIADLRKAVRGADGGKLSMQELTRYVGLKSGLERNELFAKRDAKKDAKSYYDKEYDNRKTELTTRENEEKARLKARLDEGIISDVTYQGELNALAIRIQQLKDKADADHQANIDNVDNETASEYRRLYGEYRQKDYSGLLSWFTEEADLKRSDYPSRKAYQRAVNAARKNYVPGVTDLASAEAMAKQIVDDIESRAGSQVIGNLWNRINAATKETLDFQYRKNMISRQQKADISASMKFYIPMRGFEDATAEDLYSYYMKPNVSGFAPTILAAQGRHTRYRSPFGMIGFMHSSAVSQGLKNEAKLELLDFVRRNPKNTVATVTRAWFVKTGETDADGKPIYEVAYPQVPEGATIDERERIIEDFETDMKERKEKGEAYNAHREVQMNGGVVAFEKDAHRTEHIVRVMEGGREYGIVINGNPAAAQAVNGIKRQGGYENFLEIMRATRRVLSQMFTTLSIPFWVSNFQRDHGQGGINTFVRNNLGYVGKYIINRWELLPQMIPLVLSSAEQGSFIDRLSPKFADYYRLYIENGGPMGQNRIETDVTFNRQLERYLRTQQNDKAYIKKGARALGDLLSAIGEGVETITRFATFVTSMEYGRPLHEAIADSKEVSTNFARKGHGRSISWEETGRMETRSGRQLGDTSGSAFETYRNYVDRALIVSSSAVLELLRAGIPFFNAAIQGIKNKTDNYRKNWVKALLADGTYFAIGFAMRYLIGGAGGDDDKEKYGHTSDYTRRNNFLTPLGEGRYHKWALSQEYRYMYALGDITAEALLQEKPYDDLALDAFEALVQVLPAGAVDPSARGEAFWIDAIKSVMPGVVTPIVEAFENKDFKGSRIYDEGFNGNKTDYPGWTKKIDTTGPGYVKAAEWLNKVSGGGEENATVRGSIDFNPAIVEHFVKSYLSGPYQIVGGVGAIVGKKVRGEEITSRDIPVWNRVFMNTNDNSRDAYYSGLYYYFKDRDKEARRLDTGMRGSQTQQAKDFRKSKDYAYMLIFKKYESNERELNQMKKAAQNAGNEDAVKKVELKTTGIRENIAKECLDVYFDRVDWKSWLEKTNSGNEN